MPKHKASSRNKFDRWDDDELEALHSSEREERQTNNGIHTNRKERLKSMQTGLPMEVDPAQWLKPVQVSAKDEAMSAEGEDSHGADSALSLAEIQDLANRIEQLIATAARLMQSVRSCGIDFGLDMDRQLSALKKRRSVIEAQIQEQVHLYDQEASKLQQALGDESTQVVVEMLRFESKKRSIYHLLNQQCEKLWADAQVFHEAIEGLAWNLDQCG